MRYTFLVLDTYHLDTVYLPKQGCEEPWLSSEAKRGPRAKHCTRHSTNLQDNEDSSPLVGYAMSIYKCKCKCMLTTKVGQMKNLKKNDQLIHYR